MYWIIPLRFEVGTLAILMIKLISFINFCLLPKMCRPVLICDSFSSHRYESIFSILFDSSKNIISLKLIIRDRHEVTEGCGK